MIYFITGINNELRNEVIASIMLEKNYTEYQGAEYKVIKEGEILNKIILYKNEIDLQSNGTEVKIEPEYIEILLEEVEENGKKLINDLNSKLDLRNVTIKIVGNFDRYGGIEIINRNMVITISIMYDSYGLIFKKKESNKILYEKYDLELDKIIEKIKKILE